LNLSKEKALDVEISVAEILTMASDLKVSKVLTVKELMMYKASVT
jgi:hypothetical protein